MFESPKNPNWRAELNSLIDKQYYNIIYFKSEPFSIIMVGPYVRLERIACFDNLGMLELSYRYQTLHGDFCSS